MESLRQEYAQLRDRYHTELYEASREQDPTRMEARVATIIQLNSDMSRIAHEMQGLAAHHEGKVDLKSLQEKLNEELVRIQRDTQVIQSSRDQRITMQRMLEQLKSQEAVQTGTLQAYLLALAVGIVLVMLALLQISWSGWAPAMPPIAAPAPLFNAGPG